MADGPRCKRRKQANPRRKNGKGESRGRGGEEGARGSGLGTFRQTFLSFVIFFPWLPFFFTFGPGDFTLRERGFGRVGGKVGDEADEGTRRAIGKEGGLGRRGSPGPEEPPLPFTAEPWIFFFWTGACAMACSVAEKRERSARRERKRKGSHGLLSVC